MPLTVQMFWQGELSLYEQASMLSFLRAGFAVEVYSYDSALQLPPGVGLRDAGEILAASLCRQYADWDQASSLTAFSDLFRYQLLARKGGLWMDADLICLQPAPAFAELEALRDAQPGRALFARQDDHYVNGAMILATPDSQVIAELLARTRGQGYALDAWGQIGPRLISDYLESHPGQAAVLAPSSFYPLGFGEFALGLLPEAANHCREKSRDSYGIHLWNRFYRHFCIPKNVLPPVGSFLHQLFAELLPQPWPALPVETLQRLLRGTRAMQKVKDLPPDSEP